MMMYNTKRLIIRPILLEDATIIAEWKQQSLMRKMSTGESAQITEKKELDDITKYEGSLDYMMICLKDQRPIGYCRVDWMNQDPKIAWLRFGLGQERQKGYMYEALEFWIQSLFDDGMVRMDAEVYDFNEASIALLKKLGFRQEGIRRQAHYDKEGAHDVLVMGLLKLDWSAK